jgi:SAM-dependent methyltransferase
MSMTLETPSVECYALATGEAGVARLALFNSVYGPDAAEIMTRIGIPRGGRIADIGCGTGTTARWFARMVGAEGEVFAVDASVDQLEVARRGNEVDGHRNIRLVNASAYSTGLSRCHFDVVHCRALLDHLRHPLGALREMAALARPGGVVICFDFDFSGLFSFPATDCYGRVRDLILAFDRLRGIDNSLALELPRMLQQVGLIDPDVAIIHPIYLRGERKRFIEYSFLEASPHFVKSGLISDVELKQLSADLAAVAANETISVAQSRMPVTWARKPL